jgi:hypothetical protein
MPTPSWLQPLYRSETISLGATVTLTNIGTAYDAINASKGLGLAVIDFTNVQSLEFGVFVSKVGGGTQSWQLWNVTDAAEIAVINDAGAAGDKLLTTSVTPGLTGLKTVRVRAKSTTGADDPIYYGAYVRVS